jgi:hypothetical protein
LNNELESWTLLSKAIASVMSAKAKEA